MRSSNLGQAVDAENNRCILNTVLTGERLLALSGPCVGVYMSVQAQKLLVRMRACVHTQAQSRISLESRLESHGGLPNTVTCLAADGPPLKTSSHQPPPPPPPFHPPTLTQLTDPPALSHCPTLPDENTSNAYLEKSK